jgi:hypothetical protein
MTKTRKKLIEVALPLDAISQAPVRGTATRQRARVLCQIRARRSSGERGFKETAQWEVIQMSICKDSNPHSSKHLLVGIPSEGFVR